ARPRGRASARERTSRTGEWRMHEASYCLRSLVGRRCPQRRPPPGRRRPTGMTTRYITAMRSFVLMIALLLAGCATAPRPPIDLANANVVDLTYPFDKTTLYWPNSPGGFELKQLAFGKTAGGYFYASNAFCAPEHGGTHLDAPIHFAQGAPTVDQIPVRQLLAPAAVIDISSKTSTDPDQRLTVAYVPAWP